jgi:hypothetical protein
MPKQRPRKLPQQLIDDLTSFFAICAEHKSPRRAFEAAKKPGVWKILQSDEILYNDNPIIKRVRMCAKERNLPIADGDLFGHFEGMVQCWSSDCLEKLNSKLL